LACDQARKVLTSIWIWREAMAPWRPADARIAADDAYASACSPLQRVAW
jgi:hypothetical protein